MRNFMYGILIGFLLVFACLFPGIASATQCLPDSSVAYADSVAVRYEKALDKRGYEPDGQPFAIQVTIALRYRFLQGGPVDEPVRVLAIKDGDPIVLMVSQASPKPDDVAPVDSSDTTKPSSDESAVSDSPDEESERIGAKIGAYLSSNGYTGVCETIDDQATRYLTAHPASKGEAEHVTVPVRVIRGGHLMTLRISADDIGRGSRSVPLMAKARVPKRQDVATKKIAHSERTGASRKTEHGIAVLKNGTARERVVSTATRSRFSDFTGHRGIVPMTFRKTRFWLGHSNRHEGIANLAFAGHYFRESILRSLWHRTVVPRTYSSGDNRTARTRNPVVRLARAEVLRN